MTAATAKEISDQVNYDNLERADADLDHVEIEIQNAANEGSYSLSYTFVPDKDFSLVNEIKNRLLSSGFLVEITKEDDCFVITIDWSMGGGD